MGFYTDTTVCIGCKACEVACKQWNQLPADGFELDRQQLRQHRGAVGDVLAAREVRRAVRRRPPRRRRPEGHRVRLDGLLRAETHEGRWLMMSDVCKHCVAAPCQQACPTGAIIHNEFANVYIQPDICNGCAYCVAACPFGVITRSTFSGHAHKCTLCYDRQKDGLVPGMRQGVPDGLDPVRPDRRAARAGPEPRGGAAPARRNRRAPLRRRPDGHVLPSCTRSTCWSTGPRSTACQSAVQPVAHMSRDYLRTALAGAVTLLVPLAVFLLWGA